MRYNINYQKLHGNKKKLVYDLANRARRRVLKMYSGQQCSYLTFWSVMLLVKEFCEKGCLE